jgi:hypothetical protein
VGPPAASDPEPAKQDARHAHEGGEEERYGPLALRRLRKEDGRALILYRRAAEPEADEG